MILDRCFIFVCCFVVLTFFLPEQGFSQIKTSKDPDVVNSRYVVSDSAVFEFYINGKDFPYKLYDFSTQQVYVFFGGSDGKSVVEHSFDTLYKGEVERILSIGCDAPSLSRDFKRFCK